MKKFIQITRHLYEEPYTLNLVFIVSNGRSMGHLEILLSRSDLEKLGTDLTKLKLHKTTRFRFVRGSELPADNHAWYFRFGVRASKKADRCRFNFRFNNNRDRSKIEIVSEPPQLVDLEINTPFSEIGKLGKAIYELSQLNKTRLFWCEDHLVVDNKVYEKDPSGDVISPAFEALWTHLAKTGKILE